MRTRQVDIHIQPEQLGHALVATMAPLQAGQAGEESPLLFVQQTIEKDLDCLPIVL